MTAILALVGNHQQLQLGESRNMNMIPYITPKLRIPATAIFVL